MKVAIIGAGTSGLSCAIELEKNGINPTIFERNGFIGEYNEHVSAFLGIITRPVLDPVIYMDRTYGIKLTPLNELRKVIHHSPNNKVTVSGELGYLMIRGKEETSVKNQLYRQVKSKVHFNTFVEPKDIEDDFDYVVVADGHWTLPTQYGIWQEAMRTWVVGGTFEGDFEYDTLLMWLDNELTNGAYIYCAPYSKNKAIIAQIIQNIEQEEVNSYWQRFLRSHNILNKYNLLETWMLPHHTGFVSTNKVGKIYFIGAAGGGIEPFLGFGQFNAVVTGVMAAKSIARGEDVDILLTDLKKKSEELKMLRPLMNNATNDDFDNLLTYMKTPGLRTMVYKSNMDIIKAISKGLNIVSKVKKN